MYSFIRHPIASRYRSLKVATQPTVEPISVTEAKDHLRVIDYTGDDEYIATLVTAARQWCEDYCDRTFADQAYTVAFDDFWASRIELPRPPVRLNSVGASATVTINYVDTGGATQTLTWSQSGTQDFRLDRDHVPALIYPLYQDVWPSVRLDEASVQITYLAGYGNPLLVPRGALHAMKLLIGHWYSMREAAGPSMQNVPMGVHALLDPLKWKQYA